jgi:DNA polymerase-3 subunit delta
MSVGPADSLMGEVINGFAGNMGEVAAAVNRLRQAVQTLPMFGEKQTIWMKDVNFLADTPTGRAEGTIELLEELKALLQNIKPEETAVLITASPVDRRRSFIKWCEQNADFVLADDGEGGAEVLERLARAEAETAGAQFAPGALELLLARIGPNARLVVEETRKLANFAEEGLIQENDVAQLTPNVAEGDFFESAEAFFSGDLPWTLSALQRHFFAGGDARPVIAALQNRNRLLLQVRTLVDIGAVQVGARGIDGLAAASRSFRDKFGDAAGVKSSYNVFSQNAWYLGKLAGGAKLPPLRRLIDIQRDLVSTFDEIVRRPDEQEEVLRDLAVRSLS